MRFWSTCIATLLALAAASTAPATEIFLLVIDGIPGTSMVPGHQGAIPVTAFSNSITNKYSAGAGRSTGPFACQPLQIMKGLDSTSPALYKAVAMGTVHSGIVLQAFTINEGAAVPVPVQFLQLTLTNAVLSSVKVGGDATNSARTETLTINAEQIAIQTMGVGGSEAVVTCGGQGL